MDDLVDALLALLEPEPTTVVVDRTLARPYTWAENTLYGFPSRDEHALAGAGSESVENFEITVVYSLDSKGEESKHTMDRDVSLALFERAHRYTAAIAANRSTYAADGEPTPWHHIQAVIDYDYLRDFEVRGFALIASGHRRVSGGQA